MISAGALSLVVVGLCVLLQYQVTGLLLAVPLPHERNPRLTIVAIVSALLLMHAAEIGLFGLAHFLGWQAFGLGDLVSARTLGLADIFYYSAETFTTLGVGDIVATSNLRMLTSVESLVGILLLSWSASLILVTFQRAQGQS